MLTASQYFTEAVRGYGDRAIARAFVQIASGLGRPQTALIVECHNRARDGGIGLAELRGMVSRLLREAGEPSNARELIRQILLAGGFANGCQQAENLETGNFYKAPSVDPIEEGYADFLFNTWDR